VGGNKGWRAFLFFRGQRLGFPLKPVHPHH